jgi:putative ABC transport system permease protein
MVLLVSAGLLLGSMRRLFAVDSGFDASHIVTVQVQESGQRYRKDPDRLRFFDQALERVRQAPGVVSAGFTSQLPLSGDHDVYGMMFEGENNNDEAFFKYNVTPGYLEAMRIPLIAGRLLNEQDMLRIRRARWSSMSPLPNGSCQDKTRSDASSACAAA